MIRQCAPGVRKFGINLYRPAQRAHGRLPLPGGAQRQAQLVVRRRPVGMGLGKPEGREIRRRFATKFQSLLLFDRFKLEGASPL